MTARIVPLSHTADVGFRVNAGSEEELFSGAARGLVASLLDREPHDGGDSRDEGVNGPTEEWSFSRPDRERLLVAWLREILHRTQTDGLLPSGIEVDLGDGPSLHATVTWLPGDRRSEFVREIKGITYHGLRVSQHGDGWEARVVLDV